MGTRLIQIACATVLFLAAGAFGADNALFPPRQKAEPQNCIIGVLQNDGNYSTLLSALETAKMTSVLHGQTMFTLFAPNDEAFRKMSGFEDLQRDPAAMTEFLKSHIVVDRNLASVDFSKTPSMAAASGGTLRFALENGLWRVNDAVVVQPDMAASNGMVHGIDGVLSLGITTKVGEPVPLFDESEFPND